MAKSPESRPSPKPAPRSVAEPRRGFFTEAAAIVVGGIVGLFPVVAGIAVFLDPLSRTRADDKWIRITSLDSLREEGIPYNFPVVVDKRDDAWTRFLNQPIGSVYLIRNGKKVECFTATCPHAGCDVAYLSEKGHFKCPCHESAFDLDGQIRADISIVPPRGMDPLQVKVENGSNGGMEILIKFQEFYTGRTTRTAKP